jgi:exonuclease SbcC
LELEGFTAFRESTVVDFADTELFALTGPTGSGKTSVLDAIVFALYGTVPRLGDQRQVAPIIAQGMAEARVRLDFTVGTEEYTATRVVRRTKTGANTAEARLEHAGDVLAGSADEVTASVAELLGLSYEHYTKCVMLPQGEFARFLHDKPKDRQDLLVTLLDLGVYGQMAEVAGRRSAAAKSEGAVLEGRLGDLAGATDDAVTAAAARVRSLTSLVGELDAAVPELDALAIEATDAHEDATRLASEAERLAAITVPEGLDELHERMSTVAAQVTTDEAAVREAEDARSAADAALAALPDRGDLMLLRDAHDRCETLLERHAKGELVVVERRADEVATRDALAAAERALAEARAAEEAAMAAHRAHAVRGDLVVGEPCPVCLQEVSTIPKKATPPALRQTSKQKDKAERDQRGALDAHTAAKQATGVAEATLAQIVADLDSVRAMVDGQPSRSDVQASLDAIEAARVTSESAARAVDVARRSLTDAISGRAAVAVEERQARDMYDEVRDAIGALAPPPRLGTDAALVDEWRALAKWADDERRVRTKEATKQAEHAMKIAERRAKRLDELAARCRAEDVEVARGAEPAGTARQALGAATAEHQQLLEQVAAAAKLRTELTAVEARRDVARGLATHLDARHFEKWVLDEAMNALADGATELLGTLSGGQYALRVDSKGGFVVVDHRNADEVRSARTLSGGETFLASLALALALADRIAVLAARGAARLESIFLDEGFGTLDADTLDVVATAIEELGASGRLVGVVSHVPDLAERLPVRFEVHRSGNASTIERVER